MTVPVSTLTRIEKLWYADLVLAAILADQEINVSEVDFLKQVISILGPADRPGLVKKIEAKIMPQLQPPPQGIADDLLGAIFMELILIVISDKDFAEGEKAFLEQVGALFGFTDSYQFLLMKWLKAGLAWKKGQTRLLPGGSSLERVPLKQFNSAQKKWYATVLVSTILLDGQVDALEMSFLKMAISFLEEKRDQAELMAYVKNRMCPKIEVPPGLSLEVLTLIFIEVLLLISADESISFTEQNHLQQLAKQCDFDAAHLRQLIEWCKQGVQWKNEKNSLIAKVKRNRHDAAASGPQTTQGNNALISRQFFCPLCQGPVTYYQLKPKSQKLSRNIFGMTTYKQAMPGFDPVDYNHLGLLLCPSCYYASLDKDRFLRQSADSPPAVFANGRFAQVWSAAKGKHKEKYAQQLEGFQGINRSLGSVVAGYHLAMEGEKLFYEITNNEAHHWALLSLRLLLAEILTSAGKDKQGVDLIAGVVEGAKSIFESRAKHTLIYKAGRILFFIGLFFNKRDEYSTYLNFFANLCQNKKNEEVSPEELKFLHKIYAEMRKAFENRSDYRREALKGLHLRTF